MSISTSHTVPEKVDYQTDILQWPVSEIIADKGYGRGPTYSHFRAKKIRTYIPLHSNNLGKGRLSRGEFQYERRHDRYHCPQGHWFYPHEKLDNGLIKRYRIIGGHCKQCPIKDSLSTGGTLSPSAFYLSQSS